VRHHCKDGLNNSAEGELSCDGDEAVSYTHTPTECQHQLLQLTLGAGIAACFHSTHTNELSESSVSYGVAPVCSLEHCKAVAAVITPRTTQLWLHGMSAVKLHIS